jgi:hypothetical protein
LLWGGAFGLLDESMGDYNFAAWTVVARQAHLKCFELPEIINEFPELFCVADSTVVSEADKEIDQTRLPLRVEAIKKFESRNGVVIENCVQNGEPCTRVRNVTHLNLKVNI